MLKNEIKSECWHALTLWIIITWGVMVCDVAGREAWWEEKYQNWEYNVDCDSGTGFYDAICPKE